MTSDNLRRLAIRETTFSSRLVSPSRFRKSAHPLRYVHEPRDGPAFRVCLHSTHLERDWPDADVAYGLLGSLRPEYYETFRSPGEGPSEVADFAAFRLEGARDHTAIVLDAFGGETHTFIPFTEEWRGLAEAQLGDADASDQLIAFKAAEALSAHVFITTSPTLLSARDRLDSETAILSPREALPLLWSWARAFGDYRHSRETTSANAYYWGLARAITPRAHSAWTAIVRGEFVFPRGEELMSLGQSAAVRLANALEDVDRMYRAWQLPTDHQLIDEISDEFDSIILGVAAILDNLALVAVEYFQLTGLEPYEKSLTHDALLNKLRGVSDPRAKSLADHAATGRATLTVHAELRHHAVHRAKLAGVRYQYRDERWETRLWLFEPTLSAVCARLVAMREVPEEWGLTNRHGPRDEPVSFVDQPGRVEVRHSPGAALLDPMKFAPRLVASTARIVDEVFGILDLGSDPALAGEPLLDDVRPGWPLRPEDRTELVLTSPMSGLV